jgi:hypothetical protein
MSPNRSTRRDARERANRRSKRKIAERYAMRRAAFTIVSAENLSVFF